MQKGIDVLAELKLDSKSAQRKVFRDETMLKFKISHLEVEFNQYNKKEEHNFLKTVATVQRLLQRNIDIEKTTAAEWIEIVNDLNEYLNKMNQLNGRRENNKARYNR